MDEVLVRSATDPPEMETESVWLLHFSFILIVGSCIHFKTQLLFQIYL